MCSVYYFNMMLNATTITFIAIGILGITVIVLAIQNYIFKKRLNTFMRGSNGKSLEGTMRDIIAQMELINGTFDEHTKRLATLDQKAARSIQGVATLRFNPFKNAGGNNSFATAFSNEHGDGVIISTLYSRERVSMFAKPIQNWGSEYELTAEENDALIASRQYHSKN